MSEPSSEQNFPAVDHATATATGHQSVDLASLATSLAADPTTDWARVETWSAFIPPQARSLITLVNWQEAPYQQWAFQHMRELMPSHLIEAAADPSPLLTGSADINGVAVEGSKWNTVGETLAGTDTDGFLILRGDRVISEQYFGSMNSRTRHLVMSVTKSIVSCVAATLVAEGRLDPAAPVERYVPELANTGYAGARVRDVLDMRTGVKFSEAYLDPDAEVRIMERSMGWAPRKEDDPLGMYPYILTIKSEGRHNDVFTYRSIDTDTLGWICERAADQRMADMISARIWQPIGAQNDAEITADPLGVAIHDGGLSCTLRDMARFGRLLRDRGRVGDHQVIPTSWIDDAYDRPDDVRDAFARSENEPYLTGGWYRNKFWFIPGDNGPILLCLGIHGQMIFVDRANNLVGVKQSSWPTPQDPAKLAGTISAFKAIGRHLSAS